MIFLVDPKTKSAAPIEPERFSNLGFRERYDIQEWVLSSPLLLGEELLVITSEFDQFDRTSERLDVLALDRAGKLVVVELKRTAVSTLADLQALRYAAYCSTMSLDDVVELHARHLRATGAEDLSEETARQRVTDFISNPDFEELDDKPRIILAAEDFPPEMTATVLWMRSFGINIVCVRLRPHVVDGRLVLESSVIIPLPEAQDYLIRRERKDVGQTARGEANAKWTVEEFAAQLPSELRPLFDAMRGWLLSRGDVSETVFKKSIAYRRPSDNAWITWIEATRGALRVALPPEAEIATDRIEKIVYDGWKVVSLRSTAEVEDAKVRLAVDYGVVRLTLGKGDKGEREAAYQRFFQGVIDELREKHRFTNARLAQPVGWYTFTSGTAGIVYSGSFASGSRVRAELYIDTGDQAENKRIFDRLYEDRQRFEKEFAEPLSWERLDDRRASRVAVYRDGGIEASPDELVAIHRWVVDRLLEIRKVIGPVAQRLAS